MLPDLLLPYGAVDTKNPIFQYEWRHLRWLKSESAIKRYNRLTLVGLPLLIMLWWVIETLYINPDLKLSAFEQVFQVLLLAAGTSMTLSSLYSIPAVIGTFTNRLTSYYWDTLRLTTQYAGSILMSEDAIAQLRLWPLTALEIGLRISLVIWVMATQFYRLFVELGNLGAFLKNVLQPSALGFWMMLALFTLTLVLEPILRTRVIIALHMVVAVRLRQLLLGAIAGIFVVVLVHAAEVLVVITAYNIIQVLSNDPIELFIIICIVPLTVLMFGLSLLLYRFIRARAFSIAYDHALQPD